MGWRQVVLFVFAASCIAASAQIDSLPKRYQDIVNANNIAVQGGVPWHLKASFQRFNEKEKVIEDGIMEEWWRDPHSWRLSVQIAGTTTIFVHVADKTYSNVADATLPVSVQFLLPQIIEPASLDMFLNSTPQLTQRTFGSQKMDCVTQTRSQVPVYAHRYVPDQTVLCFDDKQMLRVEGYDSALEFLHNKMSSFRGHSIALDVSASDREGQRFHSEVQELKVITEKDVNLSSDGLIQDTVLCPFFVDGVYPKTKVLSKVPPVYPESARANRIGGIVLLRVMIGKDGKVSSLEVVSTPDGALAKAAVSAVQKWQYDTTVVDGHDVGFDQIVEVRFSLNSKQ